jgi:antitoxin MazE
MGTAVRTRIVKIGNSQGVRIPKLLLEQSGLNRDVEVEVEGDRLIIRSAPRQRVGWDAAFATMATHQEDALLEDLCTTNWDNAEWEWS